MFLIRAILVQKLLHDFWEYITIHNFLVVNSFFWLQLRFSSVTQGLNLTKNSYNTSDVTILEDDWLITPSHPQVSPATHSLLS